MAKLFFGGLPTEIELRKLNDHYGTPSPGLIPYTELAEVCGHEWPKDKDRMRSVLQRWRNELRLKRDVFTEGVAGQGIKILAYEERRGNGEGFMFVGLRKVIRGGKRILLIDPNKINDPKERAAVEHSQQVTVRLLPALSEHKRALTPPRPPAALPRAETNKPKGSG